MLLDPSDPDGREAPPDAVERMIDQQMAGRREQLAKPAARHSNPLLLFDTGSAGVRCGGWTWRT
jgi:hypothetical protein